MANPVRFNSLSALEKEIARLNRQAKHLEHSMDQHLEFLQHNYRKLALNSILPGSAAYNSIPDTLADVVLKHERLRGRLADLFEVGVDKLTDGLEWLIRSVFKK